MLQQSHESQLLVTLPGQMLHIRVPSQQAAQTRTQRRASTLKQRRVCLIVLLVSFSW